MRRPWHMGFRDENLHECVPTPVSRSCLDLLQVLVHRRLSLCDSFYDLIYDVGSMLLDCRLDIRKLSLGGFVDRMLVCRGLALVLQMTVVHGSKPVSNADNGEWVHKFSPQLRKTRSLSAFVSCRLQSLLLLLIVRPSAFVLDL
jgi:hypothetical protein